ncbi:MAG TPA: ATPase, T2SS/T4P/T4SS family, partial [Opitutaceae bacterium]|nr:ATPase, T2SS/T4P/T4SS family [Opitutaceae bacterium]
MNALIQESLPAALAERLTDEQRQAVLEAPRDQRLASVAAALALTENDVLALVAGDVGLEIATDIRPDRASLSLLPARLVHDYQVVPIVAPGATESEQGEDQVPAPPGSQTVLRLAASWPPNEAILDWVRTFTPRPIKWYLAQPDRVHQLIIEHFGVGSGSLEDSGEDFAPVENPQGADEIVDEDAAVVRFVSDVIGQAITDAATDIHFEPQEGQLRIRYRVDGLLVPVPLPENLLRFQDAIISRLKIMARLNISERRLPQDGRINFKSDVATLDIRVSTIPTIYAESVSLRLLNQKKEAFTMDRLGMNAEEQTIIKRVLEYPHGIILVTGPTGSGK